MPKSKIDNKDYFIGRTTGTMSADTDISNASLLTRNEYWADDALRNDFTEKYGDGAEAKFDQQYSIVAKNFNDRARAGYTNSMMTGRYAGAGSGFMFDGKLDERKDYFTLTPINQTSSGASQQFGSWSDKRWDPRSKVIESGQYMNKSGEIVKMNTDTWDEGKDGFLIESINQSGRALADFDNDGEAVLNWYYPPEQLDPHYRGAEYYMLPGYSGDFQKFAGYESVSNKDYSGALGSDMSMEGEIFGSVGGALNNFVIGTVDMFNTLGAAFTTGATNQWFEDNAMVNAGLMVSKNLDAQEDPWAVENMIGTVADVFLQLRSGKFFANAAMGTIKATNWTAKGLSGTSKLIGDAAALRSARIASTSAMTLYAGKDAYEGALAAGFTKGEASSIYFSTIGALFGVNRVFNWTDDFIDGSRFAKEAGEVTRSMLPLIANSAKQEAKVLAQEGIKKGLQEGAEEVTKKGFNKALGKYSKKLYEWGKNNVIKNPGHLADGFKGYSSAMTKEALEEMTELAAEETVKQVTNVIQKLRFGDEYGETGGKFKDIYDPGYWSEFADGLAMSAFGGALGGAIGKRFFMSNQQTPKLKRNLVDIYLSGQGGRFLDNLDRMHQEGVLGDTKLSTEWDNDNGVFLPASEKSMSMNDANHKILQHEFNYIKSVVDASGGKEAFNGMVDKHKDLVTHLKETSLTNDVHNLVNEYVNLSASIEADETVLNSIPTVDESDSEEDKDAVVELVSKANGIEKSTAKRLVEIKSELEDIKSGKRAEKYYMQAMTKGTIFDPKDPSNAEYVEKYGEDMFFDMMKESAKSAEDFERLSKDIDTKIKDNDAVVSGVEGNLSNIDSVEKLFNTGDDVFLSDKAKEELKNIYTGFKIPEAELSKIKGDLADTLMEEGQVYTKKAIRKTKDYAAIKNDHGRDVAEKYAEFAESYFNTRINEQVDGIKTFKDLQGFTLEKTDGLLKRLNEFSTDEMGDIFQLIEGDIVDAIMQKNSDPAKLGREAGSIMATDPDENYDNSGESEYLGKSNRYSHVGAEFKKNYQILEAIYNQAIGLPSEESLRFNINDVGYLSKGFSTGPEGVYDAGNLIDQAANIHQQAMSQIAPGGIPMFSNVEETQDVLGQIKARMAQIESINKALHVDVSKEKDGSKIRTSGGLVNGLASYRFRQAGLAENSKATSSDILEKSLSTKDLSPFMTLFNKTIIDPVSFANISRKPESLRTAEETETLKNQKEVLDNMNRIYGEMGMMTQILEEHLVTAKRNSSDEQSASNQKKSIAKDLIDQAEKVSSVLVYSGLEESQDEDIQRAIGEFKLWESKFTENSITEAQLSEAFGNIQTMKAIAYQTLSIEDKRNTLKAINKSSEAQYRGDRMKIKKDIIPVATMLFFNEAKFYAKYKGLLESGQVQGVPSTDQDRVAIGVASHLNTDVVTELSPYLEDASSDLDINDLIYIAGLQGTGKSTMTIGVGLSIGLSMQAEAFGKENCQVIMASNTDKQVGTLLDTANEFGLGQFLYKGISSTEDANGVPRPKDLLDLLSSVVNNNSHDLDGVSTIVFDEATFIEATSKGALNTDLGNILNLIGIINSRRGPNKPKLRFIALGDGNQNGFTTASGTPKNIDTVDHVIYTTPELTHSHRTSVTALTSFVSNNLVHHDNKLDPVFTSTNELGNMNSEWGTISGHGAKFGGVRFRNPGDNTFNDPELVENIETLIKDTEAAKTGKKFEVGIVLPEGEELPDGAIKDLMAKYPEHFTVTTHIKVQGDEFDYVIAKVTPADIGDSFQESGMEKSYARKLATTIGRAKFFATIINDTPRIFKSDKVESITLPPAVMTESITEDVKQTKIAMITVQAEQVDFDSSAVDTPAVDTDPNTEMGIEDTPIEKDEKAEIVDLVENTEDIEDVTVEQAKYEYDELMKGNPSPQEIETAILKILKAESANYSYDLEPGDGEPTVESLEEFLDDSRDSKKLPSSNEVMANMLEAGFIPGYTVNNLKGHWSGLEGMELDNDFLNKYFGDKIGTFTDPTEYKAAQLKALRMNGSAKDVSYALVGTLDPSSGYKRMAIVAKVNNKAVVVSSILIHMYNDDNYSNEAGKKLHKLYMDNIGIDGNMKAMSIKGDIKELLNFDQMGPGKIERSNENSDYDSVIENLRKENPLLNISEMYVSTEVGGKHRGDVFVLYSYNQDVDFSNNAYVDMLMSKGLSKLESPLDNEGNRIIKGFKEGIGIIRLDAKPLSLAQINQEIGDQSIKSEHSKLVSSTITSNKSAENMVTLVAQMRQAMDLVDGNNTTSIISEYLNNHEGELQYQTKESRSELVKMLTEMSKSNPREYNSLSRVIRNITKATSLGTQVQGDVNTKESKDGTSVLPIVIADYVNPIALINPQGDVEGHYRFHMSRFIQSFRDVTSGENTNINTVISMFDKVRELSDSNLSKGLYMKQKAFKSPQNKENNVFAMVDSGSMNVNSFYRTTVTGVQTPATRIPLEGLITFMENYKDTPKTKRNPRVKDFAGDTRVKQLSTLSNLSDLESAGNLADFMDDVDLRLDNLEELEIGLISITDPELKSYLEKGIQKLKEDLVELEKSKTKELSDNPEVKDSLESELELAEAKIKELEGKKSKIDREKSEVEEIDTESNLSEEQQKLVKTTTVKSLIGDWETKDKTQVDVSLDERGEPKLTKVVDNGDGTYSISAQQTGGVDAFVIKSKVLEDGTIPSQGVILADGSKIPTANELPQTTQFKKELVILHERVKQMGKFIFDEESLADFTESINEVKNGLLAKAVESVDATNPEIKYMNELVAALDKAITTIDKNVYGLSPEDMNARIEKVLAMDIKSEDLPDAEGNSLSALLVKYHRAKNTAEAQPTQTTEVEAEADIEKRKQEELDEKAINELNDSLEDGFTIKYKKKSIKGAAFNSIDIFKDGEKVGNIKLKKDANNNVAVSFMFINEDSRRKGIAKSFYKELNKSLIKNKKGVLHSDTTFLGEGQLEDILNDEYKDDIKIYKLDGKEITLDEYLALGDRADFVELIESNRIEVEVEEVDAYNNKSAEKLWIKLVEQGVAEKIPNSEGYRFISKQPTQTSEVEKSIPKNLKESDLSFKKGRLETFTLVNKKEVKGTAIIIEGQPNVNLFVHKIKGGWQVVDNNSKKSFPLSSFFDGTSGTKSEILEALHSDIVKYSKEKASKKVLESIGFNFGKSTPQTSEVEGSADTIKKQIRDRFVTTEKAVDYDARVDLIVNSPIISIESSTAAMDVLNQYKKDGFISNEKYMEAKSIIAKKVSDIPKLDDAARKIEEGVDEVGQLNLFGTEYEGVAEDSMEETIDELPQGRAKEKIDSILDSLIIFLPLEKGGNSPLSNKNETLVTKKNLDEAIKKADREFEAVARFIVDKATKEVAMENYENLKEEVTLAVNAKVDYFKKQEDDRDLTVATEENMFPEFADTRKSEGVNLSPEAKEFVGKLDQSNKVTWALYLNAGLSHTKDMDAMADLFGAIDEADNNIAEDIITYMERKNDDSNCK